jgi:type IV pilus assembly protein PilX
MNTRRLKRYGRQGGVVLIASLLLLLVITILALAMFRNMGLGEKIAGNVREKQRALHSAVVAEQYAEWLISSGNLPFTLVTCNATAAASNTPPYTQVQVCTNGINPNTAVTPVQFNPQNLPWTDGNGNSLGITYTLSASTPMYVQTAHNGSFSNTYAYAPAFYIQYMGPATDGGGVVYKVDAVGWGGSPLSVAVVESTYEIGSGVPCYTNNCSNPTP